jgi:hypothetical protein
MSELMFGCPKCGGCVTIADVVHATVQREYSNNGVSSTEEFDYKSSVNEKCIECGEAFDEEKWKKPKRIEDPAELDEAVNEVLKENDGLCLDVFNDRQTLRHKLVTRLSALKVR